MMRERWLGIERIWISAYIGTLYRPANSASSARSAMTRQFWPSAMNCVSVSAVSGWARPREAKYRSIENTLMPKAPKGTRPISTWRRESVSHSSEPVAMPIENTTSSSEATCSLPPSTSFAKAGNCVRNTAPKNHIHEMPSSERNTTRLSCASLRLRTVSVKGFQLIFSAASVAGALGTNCADTRPSAATLRQLQAT